MPPSDEYYLSRCLELARNGLGSVAPNPMVGAVIVNDGKVIGEGFHTAFGQSHAEVEAVSHVKDRGLLKGSTLYANLEPCNHKGKTPACTDLVLQSGIGRVVIGQTDPNPVASGGIERLRAHGVEVITGVLEKESRDLNCRFNTFHEKKRPWLILKWAQTTDGFVDIRRDITGHPDAVWITDETCRRLVHKWRSEEQAILAGSGTILADNPKLNVRSWSGQDPLRITIDRIGRLTGDAKSPALHILDGSIPTLVFTFEDKPNRLNLEFIRIDPGQPFWPAVFNALYNRNIQSVLIEGGPTLFSSLIENDLWDEARVFIGPGWFGDGIRAPHFPFTPVGSERVGNSRLLKFRKPAR
jgi:diaminohydroxyphosphoribosylaminopyrimidine deaminase/5-amino-6-(5-phosphoribosylamino)uracil reductase